MILSLWLASIVSAGDASSSTTIGKRNTMTSGLVERQLTTQNTIIATMPFTALGRIYCLKNFGAGVAGLIDCTASNITALKQDPSLVFSYISSSAPIAGVLSDGVTPLNTTLKSAYDNLCVNFQGTNYLTVSMAPCAAINGLSPWFIDWSAPATVTLPPTSWSGSSLPSFKAYASPWVNPPDVVNGWSNNVNARYCFQKAQVPIFASSSNQLAAIQVEKCSSYPENRQAWFSYNVVRPNVANRTPDELANQGDSFHNHMNNAVCNYNSNLRTDTGNFISCEAMNNNVTVLRGYFDFTRRSAFANLLNQNNASAMVLQNLAVPSGNWAMSFFFDLKSKFMTSDLPDVIFKNGLSNIFEFRASCIAPRVNSIVASMNVNQNYELVFLMSNMANETESFNTGLNLKDINFSFDDTRRVVIEITTKIEKVAAGVVVTVSVPGVSDLSSASKTLFLNSANKQIYKMSTGLTSWASPTWCQKYPAWFAPPTISQLTVTPL